MEAIDALSLMAERCPIALEDTDIQLGIRHLIINNYRVLYRILGDQVEVLHIRHSARTGSSDPVFFRLPESVFSTDSRA